MRVLFFIISVMMLPLELCEEAVLCDMGRAVGCAEGGA